MRNRIDMKLIIFFLLISFFRSAIGQEVDREEASNIAEKWINRIIHYYGDWGGFASATVSEVQELKRGDRQLGYCCRIQPQGFIIVSRRKELTAVEAFSFTGDLNPSSNTGPADFLKLTVGSKLTAAEKKLDSLKLSKSMSLESIGIAKHQSWNEIEQNLNLPQPKKSNRTAAYQAGDLLLSSLWTQDSPYNDQCPDYNCPGNPRTPVGCTATAAAQIMYYWSWPPWGRGNEPYNNAYDWSKMFDYVDPNDSRRDNHGFSITLADINAVAELCHEVGQSCDTDYQCGNSAAYLYNPFHTEDMLYGYKGRFFYDGHADYAKRAVWSDDEWFDMIKRNIDGNQPLQYAILTGSFPSLNGHSMVVDGYLQDIGSNFVHINYGYGSLNDPNDSGYLGLWDNINITIPKSQGEYLEMVLHDIKPLGIIGASELEDVRLPREANTGFRYFKDTSLSFPWDHECIFESGQNLQFLPGVMISLPAGSIPSVKVRFEGSTGATTRLMSRNTHARPYAWTNIYINGGSLTLYPGGQLKFYK